MDDIRTKILENLFINNKIKHFCLKREWFIKNNLLNLYNNIFSVTYFLDEYLPSLRERIFYIQNNFNSVVTCKYCNIRKLKYHISKVKLMNYCNNKECRSKHVSIKSKLSNEKLTSNQKLIKSQKISIANKGTFVEKFGNEKASRLIENLKQKNTGKKCSEKTKIKMSLSRMGRVFSDETKLKISLSNRKTHNSKEFKEKYKDVYIKSHKKISATMKEKILRGEFIPCITNSWTRWKIHVDDCNNNIKKFRSGWDGAFWVLNQHTEYEKLAIPYNIDGNNKCYIIDFIDHQNKIIYEIKPLSLINKKENIIKEEAAMNWCLRNEYKYVNINDDWFKENAIKIDYIKYPLLYKSMKKFLPSV